MKEVLSLSLGDADRDFEATIELLGEQVHLRRVGTNGDLEQYIRLLEENDGKVDAIGVGGFDVWLWAAGHKYAWREPKRLLERVKHTPVLDGSGLKNTLERATIQYLQKRGIVDFSNSNTLLVCAVDRFGMAEALWEQGGPVIYGDLMFGLGFPLPLRNLNTLKFLARLALPLVVQLPIRWLYPVGAKQKEIVPKYGAYYAWADVICGDAHYIRRHMPADLRGKVIVTNTTTSNDAEMFRARGVNLLVTTTPRLGGRSPGTNVLEAAIVAALGKDPATMTVGDYQYALNKMDWEPTVMKLTTVGEGV
ncbi:MAG: quinate 5-dehydrogenase [Candidatus Zipacnadales bacterium]